jgi:alpha/beta superfamily hydrolase
MYPKGNLFIPAPHGQLEAIIKRPSGTPRGVALVCHPLPQGGGTMHNKVVFRAAAGLVDAGLIVLRFNFRGVGASTGVWGGIEEGIEDVRAALEYLKGEYPDHSITLAGFSFGSRTGLAVGVADDSVRRLISIGTPVDKYDDYDFLIGCRKPILFVHGANDEFGSVANVRRLFDRVKETADAELVIFEDCGHFFDNHLNELREAIKSWALKQIEKEFSAG